MKLTQLNCDWKDDFGGAELVQAMGECGGGKASVIPYDVLSEVDSLVLVVSSEPLTDDQLDELWEAGDLLTSEDVWQDDTFEGILKQICRRVAEEEAAE